MNKTGRKLPSVIGWVAILLLSATPGTAVRAQQFDFERLQKRVADFSVIIQMKIAFSFGVHASEQQARYLGTIVSEDGLVLFNGADLATDNAYSSLSGFGVRTDPVNIEVSTLDGKKYAGEFIGADRFTRIGFLRIVAGDSVRFKPVGFSSGGRYKVGSWVALYMLLPEFIDPPLAADVGMISSLVVTPDFFPLTVGFGTLQLTSVIFDENLQPLGILGLLVDPSAAGAEAAGLMESVSQFGIPLLGIVTGDRLQKLIADPPARGAVDRGWLGIRLQALTSEMAEFWALSVPGGIIVNEIINGSPAEESGLQVGDIIYQVDGLPIEIDRDENLLVFQRMIAEMGPGANVEFSVFRPTEQAMKTLSVVVTLKEAPLAAADAPEYESEALEFTVRDLVFGDYLFMNQDPEVFNGAVVSKLKQGGLASVGGLRFGDVIQRVGDITARSADELQAIMEQLEQDRPREVIFFIWRDNQTMFVNVKTDWD